MPPQSPFRLLLVAGGVVGIAAAAWVAVGNLRAVDRHLPYDFAAFWVAGRLNADGQNPYDGAAVQEAQRAVGMDTIAVVAWNPPWVFTLLMPAAALPIGPAYAAWSLATLGLAAGSAALLWRGFDGVRPHWVAPVVALTFVPTVFLVGSGQLTAVVLVGLAGYLAAAQAGRPVLAGAAGALTAVKPHLLGLFALWLLLEAARTRFSRRVVAGGCVVGLLACVPPTIANPDVWDQYRAALAAPSSADRPHLSRWTPPLAGWWLRQVVPGRPFWVQFVPFAVGAVGVVVWYARSGRAAADRGGPAAVLPGLVGASLVVAPYGVWQHDLVLLLVPVLAAAARVATAPNRAAVVAGVAGLVGVNAAMLAMMLAGTSSEWYVWVVPLVVVGCEIVPRLGRRRGDVA